MNDLDEYIPLEQCRAVCWNHGFGSDRIEYFNYTDGFVSTFTYSNN